MNDFHSLAKQGPEAEPLPFVFEDQQWFLFPLSTKAIAAQLEHWVCRQARRNVELLRPADDDKDPLAWRVYAEDKEACQKRIERGLYGAFTVGWEAVVNGSEAGFAEALYQCVRFKEPRWTREHVARLMASAEDYEAMHALWMEFNYPKARLRGMPPPVPNPPSSPSAGTESSRQPSSTTAS